MYDEYFYVPSISKTGLKNFESIANKLCKTLKLKPWSLIVDIGGSDGSLLENFKNIGMKTINIEPA